MGGLNLIQISGNRHLQGYYIERDEIIGRLNYFNKIKV